MSVIETFGQTGGCVEIDGRGLINATRLCASGGKRWHNYRQNQTTDAFLKALASQPGITVDGLIIHDARGNNTEAQID